MLVMYQLRCCCQLHMPVVPSEMLVVKKDSAHKNHSDITSPNRDLREDYATRKK